MQNNDDETAFPIPVGQVCADMKGLSVRDWFAGQVIAGIYTNQRFDDVEYAECAKVAYRQANELMEARKKLG